MQMDLRFAASGRSKSRVACDKMLHGKLRGRNDAIGRLDFDVEEDFALQRHQLDLTPDQNIDVEMHHLHPRSKSTSTLFTATLFISFLVVGAPHLLPCPVDRRQFADSFEAPDGKRYRRRRKEVANSNGGAQGVEISDDGMMEDGRPKRECPVPKPGGIVGQIMGFKNEERPKPSEVIIQPLDAKRVRQSQREAGETS